VAFGSRWIELHALSMTSTVKRMYLDSVFVEFRENLGVAFTMVAKTMVVVDCGLCIIDLLETS
jgi:hypothetical protein